MAEYIVSALGSRALVEVTPAEMTALLEMARTGSVAAIRRQVGGVTVPCFPDAPSTEHAWLSERNGG